MKPRILLVANVEWYFALHRMPLARALRAAGCEVTVAAGIERNDHRIIEAEGFRFLPLSLERRSTAPHRQLAAIWELFLLYRRERPALVHHFTIKPVIYGSLSARWARVPAVVNSIPGLGYMFLGTGLGGRFRQSLAAAAYRCALAGDTTHVIFENPEDRSRFVGQRIVPPERTTLIRGVGVNINDFAPAPEPRGVPVLLLASRLLWDKGIGELVEAGAILKQEGLSCRVVLAGIPDAGNPNSVPQEQLECWHARGDIEWWGLRKDMPEVLRQATIVVLPTTYPEGIPRILIEAASAGRPIVATDAPGCREIVRQGENGLLVPVRDARAVAQAIASLLRDPELRARMGTRGREIALTGFSEEQVVRETLAVYAKLLGAKWPQLRNPEN
jgi:glycosyltransferase involved in cell wall biosynthesis